MYAHDYEDSAIEAMFNQKRGSILDMLMVSLMWWYDHLLDFKGICLYRLYR